ncbi:hypothetical protein XELAEV_18005152mg [Xenopus laevis]|uniref:Uncharacterized protein n=1 Tax=Xenopus laevis TaxID=8355 RepID=A0A974DWD4_XENLA|nr:hypothetical protein XELAEV_18005152mg [Xenopus laevis]
MPGSVAAARIGAHSLQPLIHLIYTILWLHHVRSVSPIKRTKRRGIEGVMWSAGHLLACFQRIKLHGVASTSIQSTWDEPIEN